MGEEPAGPGGERPRRIRRPPPLTPEEQERRWAHRIDPDLAAELRGEKPEEEPEPPRSPVKAPGFYSGVVGIVFLAVVIFAGVNAIVSTKGNGAALKPRRGQALAEFAVPSARSPLVGDANVSQDNCSTGKLPCPKGDRRTPACQIRVPGAIRVCDFFDRPLVLSFWFTRGGDCETQQDVVDRIAPGYGGRVGFLSIDVRDGRDTVRRLTRRHGWRIPVGYDRDGAVSNLYRVGGCPTIIYVLPGGLVFDTSLGRLGARQLRTRIGRLLDASAETVGSAR